MDVRRDGAGSTSFRPSTADAAGISRHAATGLPASPAGTSAGTSQDAGRRLGGRRQQAAAAERRRTRHVVSTLTDHFSQRAAPPSNGRQIYQGFFDSADVIGFDTYPVEGRCSIAQIDNVYWMQRELVSLTRGKPTFQWIEAGPMEHCRENQDPTPAVVRAETWLAIAGGARGIGYFPDWWEEKIRGEVRLTNREILALAPALLSPVAKANWSTDGPVRIGARRYNGATYVIAVNTSTADATASFSLPGLGGRTLHVFRDGRTVKPLGDLVTDKLPGLGVAIYVVSPSGW